MSRFVSKPRGRGIPKVTQETKDKLRAINLGIQEKKRIINHMGYD